MNWLYCDQQWHLGKTIWWPKDRTSDDWRDNWHLRKTGKGAARVSYPNCMLCKEYPITCYWRNRKNIHPVNPEKEGGRDPNRGDQEQHTGSEPGKMEEELVQESPHRVQSLQATVSQNRGMESRKRIKWPPANNKEAWQSFDTDICEILDS